jgi:hypothetical protein
MIPPHHGVQLCPMSLRPLLLDLASDNGLVC